MGVGIDGALLLDPAACILHEFDLQRLSEATGDLILSDREVADISVEPVCPKVCPGLAVNQLYVYLGLFTNPPHAAFEHVADTKFSANQLHVDGLALIGKGRVAGDDEAVGNARQIGGQVLGDGVSEIFLLWILR